MGFEDEVEQSLGRPCHLSDGRFKRTIHSDYQVICKLPQVVCAIYGDLSRTGSKPPPAMSPYEKNII